MSTTYDRIVNNPPCTGVTLDSAALAAVLRLMQQERVRGLSLNKRLQWIAHVQRDRVLYQKVFPFTEKANAIAWLVCTRAGLSLTGKDNDQRGKWKRSA